MFGLHDLALPPTATGPAVVVAAGQRHRRQGGDPASVTPDVIHSVYGVPKSVPVKSSTNSQAIAEFQGQNAEVADNVRSVSSHAPPFHPPRLAGVAWTSIAVPAHPVLSSALAVLFVFSISRAWPGHRYNLLLLPFRIADCGVVPTERG